MYHRKTDRKIAYFNGVELLKSVTQLGQENVSVWESQWQEQERWRKLKCDGRREDGCGGHWWLPAPRSRNYFNQETCTPFPLQQSSNCFSHQLGTPWFVRNGRRVWALARTGNCKRTGPQSKHKWKDNIKQTVVKRTQPWTHYLPTGLDHLPAATAHTNTRL